MKEELLEDLGMTKTEIKVYLTLMEHNSTSATDISNRSGLYRRNVYDALDRLIKKGLVSFAKVEGKRIFSAAHPKRLLEFLDDRRGEINSILPELQKIYTSVPFVDDVMVFKGKQGLKTIYEDVINSGTDFLKFGAGERFKDYLPYYYGQYQKKKLERGIKSRAIYGDNERNDKSVKEYIGEKRFMPQRAISPATTLVFGNKVAIIIWKENPIGIVINSREIAENYRYYFDSIWEFSKI